MTVDDADLIHFVHAHPGATPREVATHFWTPRAQLTAGARLKRLARAGRLVDVFHDGWRYWTPEGRDADLGAV